MSDLLEQVKSALSDSYAIDGEVGRGGMAVVYLATDLKHDRAAAVKVLLPEVAASIGAERFIREIRVAANLNHPNILPLLDSGEANGFLFYVMPYVEGESLHERLRREGQLSVQDSVNIARQVAIALAHAHDRGFIHRDVKPGNIMLSGEFALVTDFGIARGLSAAGGERLTQTGLALGTPTYMSPEQAAGYEGLDGRSDIYSLGCVLYEMLAGGPPFAGATPQAVLMRHMSDPVPPLRTVRPSISEPIEAVVIRALAKVPADRFATMEELGQALEAAVTDLPAVRVASEIAKTDGQAASARSTRPNWSFTGLMHQIHRRSLWQVLGVYLVGGWIALGAVGTLADVLGLPEWTPRLALLLLIVGLPIVLAAAVVQVGGEKPGEPLDITDQSVVSGTGDARPVVESPSRARTWRVALIATAGVVAAVIGAALLLPRLGLFAGSELDPQRVAVAVFGNDSGDPSLDFVGRMAADWITQGLQQTGLVQLAVPSLSASSSQPQLASVGGSGAEDNIRKLAVTSRAGTVVWGTYYLSGDSLLFQAHITDASRWELLRSVPPIAGARADPRSALEILRREVMSVLASEFDTRLSQFTNVTMHPPSYEAYRAYAEGSDLFERALLETGDQSDFEAARDRLYEAAALDSTFTLAHLRAAWANANLGEPATADSLIEIVGRHQERLSEWGVLQADLLRQILHGNTMGRLEVARKLDGADLALAALFANRPRESLSADNSDQWLWYYDARTIALHMLGEHRQELDLARKGLRKAPNLLNLQAEIRALIALDRVADAHSRVNDVFSVSPFPGVDAAQIMLVAAVELRAHGHREASFEMSERGLGLVRSFPLEEAESELNRGRRATFLTLLERWDEARVVYEELAAEQPDDVNYQGALGTLAARLGHEPEALRISDELEGLNDPYDFGRDTYWQACIAALVGHSERAVSLLRESYGEGRYFTLLLHRDYDLEPLRDDPAYQEFARPRGN